MDFSDHKHKRKDIKANEEEMLPSLDIVLISRAEIDSTLFHPVNMIYGDLALLFTEGITVPSGIVEAVECIHSVAEPGPCLQSQYFKSIAERLP